MRSLAPRARTALITATPVSAARAAGLGDAVIPSLKVTTRERVRQWHRAGLEVWPWTADEEAQWRHARSTGVDGVLTNRTGAYQDWLRASCR